MGLVKDRRLRRKDAIIPERGAFPVEKGISNNIDGVDFMDRLFKPWRWMI